MSKTGNYLLIEENIYQDILSNKISISSILEDPEYQNSENYLNIGASWDIIHYALCGEQWEGQAPYKYVVLGGEKINDEDVGYGPARYLSPTQIKEAYEVIKDIRQEDWIEKYNWDKILKDVLYSSATDNDSEEEFPEYNEIDFEELKKSLESTIIERSWYVFCKIKTIFEKAIRDSKYVLFYLS